MKVFIDTSAFIALFLKNDRNHIRAKSVFVSYRKSRINLFTSTYVLSELFTKILYLGDVSKLKIVMDKINGATKDKSINILDVDEAIFEKSKITMIKFGKDKISFVDCTSFNLYKELSIEEIFTFDSDFRKMGVSVSP